jgi:predicted MFS family arabinose efflux permease
LGFNPIKAGLFMLPQAMGSILGKRLITVFLPKAGFKGFLQANTIALGLIVCMFSFFDTNTSELFLIFVFLVFGTINSMQFTAMNSYVLIDLDHRQAGTGNSLLSVIIQICNNSGVAIGSALIGIFALIDQHGPFRPDLPSAPIFQKVFYVLGLIILAASLVMSRIPPEIHSKNPQIQPFIEHS